MGARDIEYQEFVDPQTGHKEQQLVSGFYRQLHEAYYDLDFHKMGLSQLVKKVRSLEEQLNRAKAEKEAKLLPLLGKLPPPASLPLERATTAVEPQCKCELPLFSASKSITSEVRENPPTRTSAKEPDAVVNPSSR